MDVDIKDTLDQIADQCICNMCEEKELQKANIIKFLEKYKFIIGILSAITIALVITIVITSALIIIMEIPLEILL